MSPGVVLILIFKSRLTLHAKQGTIKLAFFTVFLKKTWIFANDCKHRHIIYYWKLFFTTSMDLRSLPQNNASFSSNQFSKFCHFARKYMMSIWPLSLRMEGTITTRMLRWTCLTQESPSKVVGDSRSITLKNGGHTRLRSGAMTAFQQQLSWALANRPLLTSLVRRVQLIERQNCLIVRELYQGERMT